MTTLITSTVRFAHLVVREAVTPGDIAIDATAGNGHDTLLLAELVGNAGRVHAFDIQQSALESTQKRLCDAKKENRVQLHNTGHEHMADVLPADAAGRVSAIMFNLGFLPGSAKDVITKPATTLAALDAALSLLAPGGVLTIVCYTGHPGGAEEADSVRSWSESLNTDTHKVLHYELVNKRANAVRLYCVQAAS